VIRKRWASAVENSEDHGDGENRGSRIQGESVDIRRYLKGRSSYIRDSAVGGWRKGVGGESSAIGGGFIWQEEKKRRDIIGGTSVFEP